MTDAQFKKLMSKLDDISGMFLIVDTSDDIKAIRKDIAELKDEISELVRVLKDRE